MIFYDCLHYLSLRADLFGVAISLGDVKTATKKSDNGEYEAVEITVPEDGKIVFASATGATRIMINTIEFYA